MLAAIFAATVAPPPGKPSPQTIDRIEHLLRQDRCVKPLSRRWRHYAYSHEGETDTRYVDIWFVEAGHNGLPAGRFITEPEPPMLGDSQFRFVSGKYEIATGKFFRGECGLNHPDKPANWNGG
jgi:hypothetical protein